MSYAFIDCEPHAHSMEVKVCATCHREARNTVHYEDRCNNYCDDHKPSTDRYGRPVAWEGR
jgi:hypothetical protein